MYKIIKNLEEYNKIVESNDAVLAYFSNEACNVCKVLKPQVAEMIQSNFPKFKLIYIDTEKIPELSAQNSVFTIPTILVYLEHKEFIRKSRHIGIGELQNAISRPYEIMFS